MTSSAAPLHKRVFGIYGFEFTQPMTVSGMRLEPLHAHSQVEELVSDKRRLHLTGYGLLSMDAANEQVAWQKSRLLADAMTFAQQRQVETTLLISMSENDSISDLMGPSRLGRPLSVIYDRQSFVACIPPDRWATDSMRGFLQIFMDRFEIEQPDDPLRKAIFRELEIARLSTPFVEIHHFLAFSALELLARGSGKSRSRKRAAVPIRDLLNRHGFLINQSEVENWCRARNEAFHHGQLVVAATNAHPEIRLVDQLYPITQVLCDVVLKCLSFDDGHINWNRWRDRMPFQ